MVTRDGPSATAEAVPTLLETPFLEVYETPAFEPLAHGEGSLPETPFLSEYLLGDQVVGDSAPALRAFLEQLYDPEFDEALMELVDEADAHAELLGAGEVHGNRARAERALEEWIAPLRMEAEALFESMSEALEAVDARALSEADLNLLLEGFEPEEGAMAPAFEDFLKKLVKKAKQAVSGAVKLAKKGVALAGKVLPLGMILQKLKALVRPLLQRVLKLALNRLPPALRPAAAQLAKRFLGVRELEEQFDELTDATGSAASPDVRALHLQFDTEVAALFLAPTGPEQDALLTEAAVEADRLDDSSLTELDQAREAFVAGLQQLEDGEDPTPLVEQFVPAILPALRIGIHLAGRPKVVRFLSGYLGRLIAPYVGPQLTQPLSQAIADAGLRLMTLEAGEESEGDTSVAGEAFAALLEDALARVAELEDDELEDERVLEEVAFEGFQRAARAHFPRAVLRPGQPGRAPAGTWVAMPRRGPRRYRKYSHVFDVEVSPAAAAGITIHGGRLLATFLRDRLGRDTAVRARLHLYQAIPGTRLARIARAERAVPGLGPAASAMQQELHPLTHEAAAVLLGEPELGSDVPESFLDEFGPPAIGQRFYYLEVPGARPVATATANARTGSPRRPRLSEVTAAVDVPRSRLTLAVYLSEAQAQGIAARLRRREPLGATLAAMRPVYVDGIRSLLSPAGRRRLRIVAETSELQSMEEEFVRTPGLAGSGTLVARVLNRWARGARARAGP